MLSREKAVIKKRKALYLTADTRKNNALGIAVKSPQRASIIIGQSEDL